MTEEPEKSWIDRIAEAKSRSLAKDFHEASMAKMVQRYEDSLEYMKAIKRALDRGEHVSIWEFVDAALKVSNGEHPFVDRVQEALVAFDSGKISKEECRLRLSQEWAEIIARAEAAESIAADLRDVASVIRALAGTRHLSIDKRQRLADWRKFRPLNER